MVPKSKPEDLSGALRNIADWFNNQAAVSGTDGDFWDHIIRSLALHEAAEYIEKLEKCQRIVEHIASDGIELSWEKIENQRDHYKKLCTKMRDELYEWRNASRD